jgi:hypothetical protein
MPNFQPFFSHKTKGKSVWVIAEKDLRRLKRILWKINYDKDKSSGQSGRTKVKEANFGLFLIGVAGCW